MIAQVQNVVEIMRHPFDKPIRSPFAPFELIQFFAPEPEKLSRLLLASMTELDRNWRVYNEKRFVAVRSEEEPVKIFFTAGGRFKKENVQAAAQLLCNQLQAVDQKLADDHELLKVLKGPIQLVFHGSEIGIVAELRWPHYADSEPKRGKLPHERRMPKGMRRDT